MNTASNFVRVTGFSEQHQSYIKEILKPISRPSLPKEEKLATPHRVIIERRTDVSSFRMLSRETYLQLFKNSWNSSDELISAEEHFDTNSVEISNFEADMFEQYQEINSTFDTLCLRKLAQRKPKVYSIMTRIYSIFEKYGIANGHPDEFVIDFINSCQSDVKYLKVGEGKFGGLFFYKYTLRFSLAVSPAKLVSPKALSLTATQENDNDEDESCQSVELAIQKSPEDRYLSKRVRLVNGELSMLEKEFRSIVR